jgi:hypothetical protein
MMAATKRNAAQIAANRRDIAHLYLRERLSQAEIGTRLGMTQQMVSYDLRALEREWVKAGLMDLTAHKAAELARINELECTYWDAWEKSLGIREISTTGKTADGAAHAQIRKEPREGNPAFLAGVQWCIDRRCKLLGLDAPSRSELSGPQGGPIEVNDAREQLLRLIVRQANARGEGSDDSGATE